MAKGFLSIDYYCTKFYQNEINSKNLLELTIEQLSEISKNIYRMQETMTINTTSSSQHLSKLERYQKTLEYLTKKNIHYDLKTFDERIAFLIIMTDPNLITYTEFLKLNLISIAKINEIEDETEKKRLKEIRTKTLSVYKTTVREKIGFFDVKLLKYEELFFKRFFYKKEVTNNNQDNLMYKTKKR